MYLVGKPPALFAGVPRHGVDVAVVGAEVEVILVGERHRVDRRLRLEDPAHVAAVHVQRVEVAVVGAEIDGVVHHHRRIERARLLAAGLQLELPLDRQRRLNPRRGNPTPLFPANITQS